MNEKYIPEGLATLDRNTALENFCGDAKLLDEMLQYFADGIQEKLNILKNAIARLDCPTWASTAHSIKGEAATLCLQRINALALKLEQAGKRQETDDAENMLAALGEEARALTDALNNR